MYRVTLLLGELIEKRRTMPYRVTLLLGELIEKRRTMPAAVTTSRVTRRHRNQNHRHQGYENHSTS